MASVLLDKSQQQAGSSAAAASKNALMVGADNLQEAISAAQAQASTVMVLCDAKNAKEALETAERQARASSVVLIAPSSGMEAVGITRVLQTLAAGNQAPAIVAVPSSLLAAITIEENDTLASIAGKAIATALMQKINITSHSDSRTNPNAAMRSQMIAGVISAATIEELFPNHPWASHKEESLAACYHTIAAMFIRLGDLTSAEECLQQSEFLEDSPRALALKGIISARHGETLGAVANMVSSLQQYEQRKQNQNGHYLAFSPENIEKITYNLKEGLSALNKRNNEEALEKFKIAVFNFDSFYSDMGIDKTDA